MEISIPHIIPITSQNKHIINQALILYDTYLGKDFIPRNKFMKYIRNPEKYVVLGAVVQQKLLGVIIAAPLTAQEIKKYNDLGIQHGKKILPPYLTIGSIQSIAVAAEYRHCGIGTTLTTTAMTNLTAMGCTAFFAVSWVSKRSDASSGMFEKLGYRKLLMISNYWTEESMREGYICPNCGNPCHCSAILYFYSERTLA